MAAGTPRTRGRAPRPCLRTSSRSWTEIPPRRRSSPPWKAGTATRSSTGSRTRRNRRRGRGVSRSSWRCSKSVGSCTPRARHPTTRIDAPRLTSYTGYMASARGVRLRPPSGGSFRFDPGARCLEFAVTGEGYRAAYETLHAPADLGRWMCDAFGVAPAAVTDADLAGAKRFREAIWECADARADG